MSGASQNNRLLWLIAGLAGAAAVGFLLHRDIWLAMARVRDRPPVRPLKGVESFCDDFHTAGDLAGWSTAFPWGGRHLGQGEREQYVGVGHPLAPFSTGADGLMITARRVPEGLRHELGGQAFASGLLTSYRLFSQRYGYFQMRARFPAGKGLWPAFWLAPIDLSWPPEIDIVEMRGDRPRRLEVTVHRRGRLRKDDATEFTVVVPNMTTGYHTYGLLWTPHFIAWYFDGRRVAFTAAKDLRTKMYILLDLAVGGDWVGAPDGATHFPATMTVSYVRAFRLPGEGDTKSRHVLNRCSNEEGE